MILIPIKVKYEVLLENHKNVFAIKCSKKIYHIYKKINFSWSFGIHIKIFENFTGMRKKRNVFEKLS